MGIITLFAILAFAGFVVILQMLEDNASGRLKRLTFDPDSLKLLYQRLSDMVPLQHRNIELILAYKIDLSLTSVELDYSLLHRPFYMLSYPNLIKRYKDVLRDFIQLVKLIAQEDIKDMHFLVSKLVDLELDLITLGKMELEYRKKWNRFLKFIVIVGFSVLYAVVIKELSVNKVEVQGLIVILGLLLFRVITYNQFSGQNYYGR